MNVISAMSLPSNVRSLPTCFDFADDKNVDPAQVAFAPPTDLLCEDCNPIWENGVAA